jgi:hypothetical protein
MTTGHEEWVRREELRMEEHRQEILAIMERVLGREGLARSLERIAQEPYEEWQARFAAWLDKMREGRPPWTREDAERWFREQRARSTALGRSSDEGSGTHTARLDVFC